MTDMPVPEAAQLVGKVTRGLRWSVLNTVVSRLGSLLTGVVLARILAPEDYGVYAVALVVLNGLLSMNELGVSLAIVRWDRDVERIAPTVATLALSSSLVLYAACFFAAPLVAAALRAQSATPMIRVLCLCVLVDATAAVPAALISRGFEQGRRFGLDVAAFVLGTGLSVVLAVMGYGAWAMIWGFVLSNVIAGGLAFALAPWRTGFGFDPQVARDLLRFGLPLAGSSLVLFVMLNVDYIVVGSVLGSAALGLYLMAFNLCSWPVNVVSTTIRRVSLSGFSRVSSNPDAGARSFAAALAIVLVVALPMCVGLAAFADPVIGILYGEVWVPAAHALRYLSALALGRIVVELVYDYLVAAGRNVANLWIQVVWVVALVPVLTLGARWAGITGVATGHAIVALVVVCPVVVIALKGAGVHPWLLWRVVRRPVLAVLPMAAVAMLSVELLSGRWAALLVGGLASLGVYAACVWPSVRSVLREIRQKAEVPT